jgi:hypothetical protein
MHVRFWAAFLTIPVLMTVFVGQQASVAATGVVRAEDSTAAAAELGEPPTPVIAPGVIVLCVLGVRPDRREIDKELTEFASDPGRHGDEQLVVVGKFKVHGRHHSSCGRKTGITFNERPCARGGPHGQRYHAA